MLAPDLPSNSYSLMVLNCSHSRYSGIISPILIHLVTISSNWYWIISVPAAFLGSESKLSCFLSEIKPWSFVIRDKLRGQRHHEWFDGSVWSSVHLGRSRVHVRRFVNLQVSLSFLRAKKIPVKEPPFEYNSCSRSSVNTLWRWIS